MSDAMFCSEADMQSLVGYLGQGFVIGLGVGIALFCMGYGVYVVFDMVRGSL